MDREMSLWGRQEWEAVGYVHSLTRLPPSSASISEQFVLSGDHCAAAPRHWFDPGWKRLLQVDHYTDQNTRLP